MWPLSFLKACAVSLGIPEALSDLSSPDKAQGIHDGLQVSGVSHDSLRAQTFSLEGTVLQIPTIDFTRRKKRDIVGGPADGCPEQGSADSLSSLKPLIPTTLEGCIRSLDELRPLTLCNCRLQTPVLLLFDAALIGTLGDVFTPLRDARLLGK